MVKKKKPFANIQPKADGVAGLKYFQSTEHFFSIYISCPDTHILPAIQFLQLQPLLFSFRMRLEWIPAAACSSGHMLVRSGIKRQPSCKKQGIESGPL